MDTQIASNRLGVLAGEVGEAMARYRRGSLEAHAAYIEAGAKLVEAREAAKRGEWTPFLARAGVEERTAQRMMRLARSGAKPDTVTAFGGVRSCLGWLATVKQIQEGEVKREEMIAAADGAADLWMRTPALMMRSYPRLLSEDEDEWAVTGEVQEMFGSVRDAHSVMVAAMTYAIEQQCWGRAIAPVSRGCASVRVELVIWLTMGEEWGTWEEAEARSEAEGRRLLERQAGEALDSRDRR